MTNESKLTEDDVWKEHLGAVNVGAHWAYLLGVLVAGFIAMVALMAILGASGG